jgi:hypothetical protein
VGEVGGAKEGVYLDLAAVKSMMEQSPMEFSPLFKAEAAEVGWFK